MFLPVIGLFLLCQSAFAQTYTVDKYHTHVGFSIGVGKDSKKTLKNLLKHFNGPILLDADALNTLAVHRKFFKKLPKGTVITPHPKEFDRLFGPHASEKERRNAAINLAIKLELVIVLKGHQTLVTTASGSFLNTTGNAGLAKGGSGDALSGVITALLAQGYDPFVGSTDWSLFARPSCRFYPWRTKYGKHLD